MNRPSARTDAANGSAGGMPRSPNCKSSGLLSGLEFPHSRSAKGYSRRIAGHGISEAARTYGLCGMDHKDMIEATQNQRSSVNATTPRHKADEAGNHPHQNTECDDRQRDLHPQSEIPDGGFDPVTPRIWKGGTARLNERCRRPLPPREPFRPVQPAVNVSGKNKERSPRPEKMAANPEPGLLPQWSMPRPVFLRSSSIRFEAWAFVKVGSKSSPASSHSVWRQEAWAPVPWSRRLLPLVGVFYHVGGLGLLIRAHGL